MLGNFIIVKPDAPKAFQNGIAIPERSRRHGEFCRGEVLAVGTGMPGYPLPYKIGEFVTFLTVAGKVFPFVNGDQTEAILVPHNDVRIREVADGPGATA